MTDEFENLLGAQEDLHPELVPWLDDDGPLGPTLKHPLVFSITYAPQLNAMLNRSFLAKQEAVRAAKAAGRWDEAVFLYERPYRLDAFAALSWNLKGPDYWELLGDVWSDTENAWQNYGRWRDMLTADPEGRVMMSTPDERCVFTLTPEVGGLAPRTRIYRGYHHDSGLEGFSWTLDKARARWFAQRLRDDDTDPPARIASGWVARENVIAYLNGRDEQELVVLPEHVEELEVEEL